MLVPFLLQAQNKQLAFPLIQKNLCPGEFCSFGNWQAKKELQVYNSEALTKPSFKIRKHENFTALSGNIHVIEPGILLVTESFDEYKKGEKIQLLSYRGEGYYDIWHGGRIPADSPPEFFGDRNLKGKIVKTPKTEWWVKIKNKKGESGWICVSQKSETIRMLEVEKKSESNSKIPLVKMKEDPEKLRAEKFLALFKEFNGDSLYIYPEGGHVNDSAYRFRGTVLDSEFEKFLSPPARTSMKIKINPDNYLLLYSQKADFNAWHVNAAIWNVPLARLTSTVDFLASDEGCTDASVSSASVLKKDKDKKFWKLHVTEESSSHDNEQWDQRANNSQTTHKEKYYSLVDSLIVEDSVNTLYSYNGSKKYPSEEAIYYDPEVFLDQFSNLGDSLKIFAPKTTEDELDDKLFGAPLPSMFAKRLTDRAALEYWTDKSTFAVSKHNIDTIAWLLIVRQRTDSTYSTFNAFVWNKRNNDIAHVLQNIAWYPKTGNNHAESLIWRNRKNDLLYIKLRRFSGKKNTSTQIFHFENYHGKVRLSR